MHGPVWTYLSIFQQETCMDLFEHIQVYFNRKHARACLNISRSISAGNMHGPVWTYPSIFQQETCMGLFEHIQVYFNRKHAWAYLNISRSISTDSSTCQFLGTWLSLKVLIPVYICCHGCQGLFPHLSVPLWQRYITHSISILPRCLYTLPDTLLQVQPAHRPWWTGLTPCATRVQSGFLWRPGRLYAVHREELVDACLPLAWGQLLSFGRGPWRFPLSGRGGSHVDSCLWNKTRTKAWAFSLDMLLLVKTNQVSSGEKGMVVYLNLWKRKVSWILSPQKDSKSTSVYQNKVELAIWTPAFDIFVNTSELY